MNRQRELNVKRERYLPFANHPCFQANLRSHGRPSNAGDETGVDRTEPHVGHTQMPRASSLPGPVATTVAITTLLNTPDAATALQRGIESRPTAPSSSIA